MQPNSSVHTRSPLPAPQPTTQSSPHPFARTLVVSGPGEQPPSILTFPLLAIQAAQTTLQPTHVDWTCPPAHGDHRICFSLPALPPHLDRHFRSGGDFSLSYLAAGQACSIQFAETRIDSAHWGTGATEDAFTITLWGKPVAVKTMAA